MSDKQIKKINYRYCDRCGKFLGEKIMVSNGVFGIKEARMKWNDDFGDLNPFGNGYICKDCKKIVESEILMSDD